MRICAVLMSGALLLCTGESLGESRFPRPEFDSGYTQPTTTAPSPRSPVRQYADVAVLAVALSLASWFALRRRNRREVLLLGIFSGLYFGFYRKGCVCAVGAVQNAALALSDPSYALPTAVLAFFLLPLVFTLFFGRTFCASVCPLGAIQDVVVVRAVRVPGSLRHALGLLPHVYLGLVVLFAFTGAGFMICRYDPFVPLYRLSGTTSMLLTGGALLAAGLFLARPYCRFLCPYGVLLSWTSRFSRRHLTVTPSECVRCRLCEDSCPFGAIRAPTDELPSRDVAASRRRVALLLVLIPLLAAGGGLLGAAVGEPLARAHPMVLLADRVQGDERGPARGQDLRVDAFRQSDQTVADLYAKAESLRGRHRAGGLWLGVFLGVVFGARLLGLEMPRERTAYEPDRAHCLSCGRCTDACPVEQIRRHGPAADYEALVGKLRGRADLAGGQVEAAARRLKELMDESAPKGKGHA